LGIHNVSCKHLLPFNYSSQDGERTGGIRDLCAVAGLWSHCHHSDAQGQFTSLECCDGWIHTH